MLYLYSLCIFGKLFTINYSLLFWLVQKRDWFGWMKKFKFSLETVLRYKNQILEDLKREHGIILLELAEKEAEIRDLEQNWVDENNEFNQKKLTGITAPDAMSYKYHLKVVENKIKDEYKNLEEIQKREEEKRQQVVNANIETSILEKLKEKRIAEYEFLERKEMELFIEEFVANKRASVAI